MKNRGRNNKVSEAGVINLDTVTVPVLGKDNNRVEKEQNKKGRVQGRKKDR